MVKCAVLAKRAGPLEKIGAQPATVKVKSLIALAALPSYR
jgi:hypothetical protein